MYGDNWDVDARVVVTGVRANPDSLEYSREEEERASKCVPDSDYMKDNPVRYELYHFEVKRARLVRRLLATWFSDNDRVVGGVEVRHCVRWNENYGSRGAWDPNGCTLVETNAEKTKCECANFGSMTVLLERTTKIDIEDDCKIPMLVKYIGIGVSVFFLTIMAFGIILGREVWDMFHSLRLHVGFTWATGIILHVITDIDAVRDDPELNLIFGFIMKYFYTASNTWMMMEAHATFKAFTGGIISGRNKVYRPFGYGTPFLPLGLLLLMYADDLGVDPRCFVGWNTSAKFLYLLYNVGIAVLSCIIAIIIIFNIARPQTKRRNVVADLNSQARGTVVMCFSKLVFWICATITYTFNQESDHQDPYCKFVILLGWFGFWMFFVLALCSKKYRQGTMGRKSKEEEPVFDSIDTADDTEADTVEPDAATITSEVSRPSSASGSQAGSRPATARSTTSNQPPEQEEEEEEEPEQEEEEAPIDGDNEGEDEE